MAGKLAIFGVGGIGGVIGGYLARAGHQVVLIDQWPENIETIRSRGLTVTAMEGEFTVRPRALHLCDLTGSREQFDTVILAVKSYDTDWSARLIEAYLSPRGYVVSAQNSINDERIAAVLGWSRVVGCVITLGAAMYEPGHAMRTSPATRPAFALGEPSGVVTPRLQALAQVMSAVGPTKTTTNLWGERWAKLALNCMGNALAGFTGLKATESRQDPRARRLQVRLAAETVQVGTAWGVSVESIGGVPAQTWVDALTDGAKMEELEGRMLRPENNQNIGYPSLAQDVMKGRKTEVEFLNGLVVEKGRQVGVPTPANQAVVELMLRVESGELKPSPDNLRYVEQVL